MKMTYSSYRSESTNIVKSTKSCGRNYKANLSRMCKKMLGIHAKKPIAKMTTAEKRAFWCVMNVFRKSESHHRYAHKSGRGMRIIEEFVNANAK